MDAIAPATAMMVYRTERIFLVIGLTFLAVWGALRFYSSVASWAAIARFHSEEAASPSPNSSASLDPSTGSAIDFRLWSPRRMEAYRDSLSKKTDAPLAVLRIAKINLEVPVFNDTDDLTLNRGVGRILGTAQVGQPGNLGIAGHRDGFFRGLQSIEHGDIIEFERPGQTDQYIVSQIQIVDPEDVSVLGPTPARTLTLVTCFPFYFVGNAPKRFIVTASIPDSSQRDKSASAVSIPRAR